MAVELHLPDLPEVPISLGPERGAAPRPQLRWHLRLRDLLSSYLPLLLMVLLALGSWWLVKNAPPAPRDRTSEPVRTEPDYTMSQFVLERFESSGRLKLRLEGAQMRHYPDTDRTEIEGLRLRAMTADGRITLAQAQSALSNGDASEIQLNGAAQVTTTDAQGQTVVLSSEFLHLFTVTERVRTHLPVQVQRMGAELHAAGLDYDHGLGRLELMGPQRATFPPRTSRSKP